MVGGDTPVLASAQATFDELEKKLTDKPRPAPIDLASRARAECLAALTAARRPATSTSTIGKSDQLLSELSAMGGLLPTRDDRGVVVTLRNLFTGGQLTGEARDRLSALGRVARAHAEFPVEVVVHTSETKAGNADRDRGDAVAKALVEAGADPNHLFVDAAGSAHPVLAPPLARESSRNDRIEIVFVDPGG
jgi:outer membrane protein OmpA-like peptidoglycan-associated protein